MNELISIGTVSPLRQRLIDDMTMRRFSPETQRNYLRDVGRFATWLGRSPHTAAAEDIRRFQIEQQQAGVPAPTMNSIVAALRFFFTHTLDRPDLARKLVRTAHARKIPVVLTMAEMKRLLDATRCLKHQAALSVAYGAGLRVLGALFRRLFLTRLLQLHGTGKLAFFGKFAQLADRRAFLRHLAPVRKKRWVVYAKPPFAGPEAVLAYLSRYTHRVAISNSRLISFDQRGVTFRYKDYRRSGADRQQVMTLPADEFIRRFLLHALPRGFHRIRHYGLLASARRKASLDRARRLLSVAPPATDDPPSDPSDVRPPCPCCGGRMIIIETFERRYQPRAPPPSVFSSGIQAP